MDKFKDSRAPGSRHTENSFDAIREQSRRKQDIDENWSIFRGRIYRERNPDDPRKVRTIVVDTREDYIKIRDEKIYNRRIPPDQWRHKYRELTDRERAYVVNVWNERIVALGRADPEAAQLSRQLALIGFQYGR